MNIKKEVGKVQDELTKYGLMTPGKGIDFPVSISIENMENDSGKMKKHIVAKWNDVHGVTQKVEELNKYFNGELFAKGITQKVVWIKSSREDKVEYLKKNPFGHPALFPVWLESKKVA
jgi:hypothetical protein